jgi:alcohol dehydrogenase
MDSEKSEEHESIEKEKVDEIQSEKAESIEKNVEDSVNDSNNESIIKKSIWEKVDFTFPQPRIRFGKGIVKFIPNAIIELLEPTIPSLQSKNQELKNPKAMLISGASSLQESGAIEKIVSICDEQNIAISTFSCGSGEANVEKVNEGVILARQQKPHFVIGIGGGSVLDTAKSIAGIAINGGKAEDYHDGKEFENPGIPFIAIPTTSGTGSEITNNAVLTDYSRGFKKSIRGKHLIAQYILLDPELTLSCPPKTTASSGADALVQAIEAYVSIRSQPLADVYALEAIILIGRNLQKVYNNGDDYDARAEMMLGSHFAGIALANVGLGLVHGFAHPLGFKYSIPHGVICGALLPYVIEYNIEVRAEKYAIVAKLLNELDMFSKYEPDASDQENARRLAAMIKELFSQVQIPIKLRDLKVQEEDFDWIVENTKGGSVNSNPRTPDAESMKKLLKKAW